MKRHFTATAIVIDSYNRVLLLWHNNYRKWMPPGGHMDEHEIPEEAALRECKEETGLDVVIVSPKQYDIFALNPAEGHMLHPPFAFLCENVPENPTKGEEAHQHLDFVYLARPVDENQVLRLEKKEGSDLRWFTRTEIEAMTENTNIFVNLKTFLLNTLNR